MLENLLLQIEKSPQPELWTVASLTAIVGAIAAVVALPIALWPVYRQRRTQRMLEEQFGAEFYDSETIRSAMRYYVRPKCSSIDPAQEAEPSQVIVAEEDLFYAVDKYLSSGSSHRHLLILADSGMGKSAFVLNYYARNQKLPKRKRHRLAVVPLGIPNALTAIEKIENKRETVIFLDAFDEDTKAIQDHRGRLMELMQACSQFKRVLMTCRTQFFPKEEEIPKQTGIAVIRPRKPGESGVYEFWKYYLMPLRDKQIKEFINKRYPFTSRTHRSQAADLINKIPLLSVRPMILSYIPDLLESGRMYRYAYQIYEQVVEKWLERESRWVAPELLLRFSEELAVDLYTNRERRGFERISRQELAEFIKEMDITLDEWKATGRSLLNRDGLGNLKFSHRSLMEYLFVQQFARGCTVLANYSWTDQMLTFLWEMLQSEQDGTQLKLVDSAKYKRLGTSNDRALTLLYSELVSYKLKDSINKLSSIAAGHLLHLMEICRYVCTSSASTGRVGLFLYSVEKLHELLDDGFSADVSLAVEMFNHKPSQNQSHKDPGYLYSPRQISILSEGQYRGLHENAFIFAPDGAPGTNVGIGLFFTALDDAVESFKTDLMGAVESFIINTGGAEPESYLFIPVERDNLPVALLFAVSDDPKAFDKSRAEILYSKLNLKSVI